MFYSVDLLNLRGGGKFNMIWLFATIDPKTLAKKKKKDLLSMDFCSIVKDLEKMLPVRGKERSFSLRTSAILTMGLSITLRLRVDHLHTDLLLMMENCSSKYLLSLSRS